MVRMRTRKNLSGEWDRRQGRGGSETEKRPRRSIGERSREYKSQLNDGAVGELCETIDPGPVRSDELSNESSFHRQLRTH